jgi:hypothetical protein
MKIKICLLVLLAAAAWSQQIPLSIMVAPTPGEAERALAALPKGGDFAELAHRICVDRTASPGGYLGVALRSTAVLQQGKGSR